MPIKTGIYPVEPGRHVAAVMRLSPENADRVWQAVKPKLAPHQYKRVSRLAPLKDPTISNYRRLLVAVEGGICQADMVLSLIRSTVPADELAISEMIGRPIQKIPANAHLSKTQIARAKLLNGETLLFDKKIIRIVAEGNPRRPGTRAHEKYALYRDGMTVGEYLHAAGDTTRGNVRCDVSYGRIRLEDPTE